MPEVIDALSFSRTRPLLVDGDAIYVTGEDSLRVSSFNSLAGVVLAVEGRFTRMDGVVVPFVERHVPNTDRSVNTTLITLGEGFLGNLQIRATTGAPQRGQCYVFVEVVRGRLGALQPAAAVLGEYVTDVQRVAFPGSPIRSSTDGRGFMRLVVGGDPIAGAECSDTVPTGARWRLVSYSVALVTSAVVANRFPVFTVDDGATVYHASSVGAACVASTTYRVTASAFGVANAQTPLAFGVALPADLIAPAGHRLRTATTALDAGDNYGAPQILVEEWIAG